MKGEHTCMHAEEKFWHSRKEGGHAWVLVRRQCTSIQYQLESCFYRYLVCRCVVYHNTIGLGKMTSLYHKFNIRTYTSSTCHTKTQRCASPFRPFQNFPSAGKPDVWVLNSRCEDLIRKNAGSTGNQVWVYTIYGGVELVT